MSLFISKGRKLSPLGWVGWVLYQPYKWLIFAPFFVLTTLFFGSAAAVFTAVLPARWVSLICGTFWSRLNAWLTPMPVDISGREIIDSQQSYVVVANHESLYDIFVLYGYLGIDFKWVIKQEMRSVPGLGIGCEKLGHIFVDRSNRKAALAAIDAARSKINNGTSVVFFPEGTRSRDGKLRQFKKGAFRFALDLDLPILPVTIIGTRDILPSDSLDLLPGKARLIIGEPIPVDGLDGKDIPRLMEQVRSVFQANIAEQAESLVIL
ncbi:MAG: lysophospholipid acyltransferase family protein [Woeseiaceae bacterium]